MGAPATETASDRLSLGINQEVDLRGGGVSDQGRGLIAPAPSPRTALQRTVLASTELVRLSDGWEDRGTRREVSRSVTFSVSCACALLGALDELSQGRGIQPEQPHHSQECGGRFASSGLGSCGRQRIETNRRAWRRTRGAIKREEDGEAEGRGEKKEISTPWLLRKTGRLSDASSDIGSATTLTADEECRLATARATASSAPPPCPSNCSNQEADQQSSRLPRPWWHCYRCWDWPRTEVDSISCRTSPPSALDCRLVGSTLQVLRQKDFERLIQSSGVLVVLSQAWIEELYHQELERNLLAEAGYWGSPEDHTLPLINMLTDIDQSGQQRDWRKSAGLQRQGPTNHHSPDKTGERTGDGRSTHLGQCCWNVAAPPSSLKAYIPEQSCTVSEAARRAALRADRTSSGSSSPHGSRVVYGRHPERRTGDGEPQPRLLATCLQATELGLSQPGHPASVHPGAAEREQQSEALGLTSELQADDRDQRQGCVRCQHTATGEAKFDSELSAPPSLFRLGEAMPWIVRNKNHLCSMR
ncbi:brefeldin A-inhibited guanine nucleotide-exchange protein 3 [Lates japonicus]|uniref:Brefeldin A-inhibited guanine nucleotide-exchange protein 3 n=1 Tax=Lates japonicus TaxID=270547 RepID=A0AAD3RJ00_LATJO|nr:brefeldin A-inhibited guanine nucleotide-exchange protein 3 [Lates japonicus]